MMPGDAERHLRRAGEADRRTHFQTDRLRQEFEPLFHQRQYPAEQSDPFGGGGLGEGREGAAGSQAGGVDIRRAARDDRPDLSLGHRADHRDGRERFCRVDPGSVDIEPIAGWGGHKRGFLR